MDSLLCDEVWLSSSPPPATPDYCNDHDDHQGILCPAATDEDGFEQALALCLEKELSYMPKPRFAARLRSKNLILARFRAFQWLIKSCGRLKLSPATVFDAANCFDRFISINECNRWDYWMVELLSVACLSVASKFNETTSPSLYEIQMEGLDHPFQSITIQQMELILLQALEWRLCSTTLYSYVELLTMNISIDSCLHKDLSAQLTKLLLQAMLDPELVEYRPSTVAVSALRCILEELVPAISDAYIENITSFFNQEVKENVGKCHKYMELQLFKHSSYSFEGYGSFHCCSPSSPVTVLLTERVDDIYDCNVDLSLFKMGRAAIDELDDRSSKQKRKREEE